VSGGLDQSIKIWDFSGCCLKTLCGHHGGVTCLQLNADESRIFSGSLDGDIRFWDVHTGDCVETLDWIRAEGHRGVIRLVTLLGVTCGGCVPIVHCTAVLLLNFSLHCLS
jgi:F-box/WD-40 domain protein 7